MAGNTKNTKPKSKALVCSPPRIMGMNLPKMYAKSTMKGVKLRILNQIKNGMAVKEARRPQLVRNSSKEAISLLLLLLQHSKCRQLTQIYSLSTSLGHLCFCVCVPEHVLSLMLLVTFTLLRLGSRLIGVGRGNVKRRSESTSAASIAADVPALPSYTFSVPTSPQWDCTTISISNDKPTPTPIFLRLRRRSCYSPPYPACDSRMWKYDGTIAYRGAWF